MRFLIISVSVPKWIAAFFFDSSDKRATTHNLDDRLCGLQNQTSSSDGEWLGLGFPPQRLHLLPSSTFVEDISKGFEGRSASSCDAFWSFGSYPQERSTVPHFEVTKIGSVVDCENKARFQFLGAGCQFIPGSRPGTVVSNKATQEPRDI